MFVHGALDLLLHAFLLLLREGNLRRPVVLIRDLKEFTAHRYLPYGNVKVT